MVEGFAGFGFPKAHGAAFGLLAYQSTWLRVHYGPEFLCALLNEQPMGFYAPDTLVHEAEGRGIPVLGLDVNASEVRCTVEDGGAGVRLGLGYIKDVAPIEIRELVAERERGGRFRQPRGAGRALRRGARHAGAARVVGGLRRPGGAMRWHGDGDRQRDGRARRRPRPVAARDRRARTCGRRGGHPAGAAAGAARGAAPAPADPLAAADRRLRHHRGHGRRPRDGRPAPAAHRADARHRRPSSPGCPRAAR